MEARDDIDRDRPPSPLPLPIDAAEWRGIEAGIVQRAALLELVLDDLYGSATLVERGLVPAAVVAGSPGFLRALVGRPPPGGRRLHLAAFDLGRDAGGGWRVLRDRPDDAAGLGRALGRAADEPHAPFLAAFRDGVAASCRRVEPRIALLSPGGGEAARAEGAFLARRLGFPLVEAADLHAPDERLYLRTIGGLKRLDALWRWGDPRPLDPLAFDSRSARGVPGLVDAYLAGELALANAPGAGVVGSAAMAAYLPALAAALLGEELRLPGPATWWCGDPAGLAAVRADPDRFAVAPAFDGAASAPDLDRRPQDRVGRERWSSSAMPVTLRVFAARGADGDWRILPGGWARTGGPDGERRTAEVRVHRLDPVAPATRPPTGDDVRVRRNPGTLPSRAADDLFWLGRYLERGEALLALVRALDGAPREESGTTDKLVALIVEAGAAAPPAARGRAARRLFAEAALGDPDRQSVAALDERARRIGAAARERLSADTVRLLSTPSSGGPGAVERIGPLGDRYAALAGLAAEHMERTDGWAFHDLGRRIERALSATRVVARFGLPEAGADAEDLRTLLDLSNGRVAYRQRYRTGVARAAAVDLVALDPGNPRGIAFQLARIDEHLARLPVLADDGMAEPQQVAARALLALATGARAETLDAPALGEMTRRLHELSDLVARRYFLHGADTVRAARATLA